MQAILVFFLLAAEKDHYRYETRSPEILDNQDKGAQAQDCKLLQPRHLVEYHNRLILNNDVEG